MNVALLGLGVMGRGMAGQLLAHGHQLAVYNRHQERSQDVAARGARVAATPRAAADGAAVVITMVSNDEALRTISNGPDGLLSSLAHDSIMVQMSTVSPEMTLWLAGEVAVRGAAFLDAPVVGSAPEADSGRLWVLAGGDEAIIERARPVLDSVSQTVYHMGEIGQGTRAKLANNLIVGGIVSALAEGVALLEASGIDPRAYLHIVEETALPGRLFLGKGNLMATNDFAPRFSLDNMAKDIGLAIALGASYGLSLHQGEASLAMLRRAAAIVGADKDMAAAVVGVRPRDTV